MSDLTVAVLIVNWNAGPLLARCLAALGQQRRQPDRVILVDNASTDDSLRLAALHLNKVEVIRLEENAGFARANNIAAKAAADCDMLALLNPDAFPEPDWLEALMTAAAADPSAGAFASQIRLDPDPDLLDGAGDSYHASGRAWRNGHGARAAAWPNRSAHVFAPCAAAALYRRKAFVATGGFDERYFCYFEDVDLGFRLQLLGFSTRYVPAAIVRHVSSALSGYRSDFAVYHGERNMVWTFVKNMPSALLWRTLPQHVLLNAISLAFYPWRGQGRVVWRAKRDALRGLGAAIAERRRIQGMRTATPDAIRSTFTKGVAAPYLRLFSRRPRTGPAQMTATGATPRADSPR